MINKLISIAILAFICAVSITEISAQTKEKEHKVVIIEKEVDENGNVTEKKVVKTGAEAEAYLSEMELMKEAEGAEGNIWITGDGEEIDLNGKKAVMIRREAYEIETEDDQGQVKILKWDGEGEMPEEIKKIMEKEGLDIEGMGDSKKSRVRIKRKGAGDEKVMDFEFEGDELPDEVKEMLEKEGIDLEQVIKGDGMKEIKVRAKAKDLPAGKTKVRKAQLGVNIEAHPNGVKVSDVIPDSSAAIGGLQAGDVITQVDGVTTKEVMDLVAKISEYKPDDKVEISFERDGRPLSLDLILKEKIDPFPHKNWESVMKGGKNQETIEVEIEEEIIREKKK